jgi:hypothetical protein
MTPNQQEANAYEKTGGPAFPCSEPNSEQHGMSLRDYFAAAALTGLLADSRGASVSGEALAVKLGEAAYLAADAMLKERSK